MYFANALVALELEEKKQCRRRNEYSILSRCERSQTKLLGRITWPMNRPYTQSYDNLSYRFKHLLLEYEVFCYF